MAKEDKRRQEGGRREGPTGRDLGLARLGLNDHACLIRGLMEDGAAAAAAFLEIGLARGERCVHVADEEAATAVLAHLRRAGADVAGALAAGGLKLVPDYDAYGESQAFEPVAVREFLRREGEAARQDGYPALRVSSDAPWALSRQMTLDRLLDCEMGVKRALAAAPLVALWQYDGGRCSARALGLALRMHPFLVHGGMLHRNPFFVACRQPPLDPDEDREELNAALADIVERDLAEASFARTGEMIRFALEGGEHVLWVWDPGTDRISFEGRWAELPGLPEDASEVTLAALEQVVHPKDLGPAWRCVRDHLEGRKPRIDGSFRVKHRGGWRWLHARGATVERGGEGQPVKLAGTITDVTAERATLELGIAEERLATAAELAARLAHDVNTPLGWMVTNLDYLKDTLKQRLAPAGTSPDDKLLDVIDETRRGAALIHEAVETLHRSVRPVAGGPAAPRDVARELEEAVAAVRDEIGRRAKLIVDLPKELPAVLAPSGALAEMFEQFLRNAAEALPEGAASSNEVRVAARLEGDRVIVELTDTGIGMSAHVQARMFDPFYSTRASTGRMGLGATVARSLAHGAGGSVAVESSPGRGTTVRISLPIARSNALQ